MILVLAVAERSIKTAAAETSKDKAPFGDNVIKLRLSFPLAVNKKAHLRNDGGGLFLFVTFRSVMGFA